VTNRQSITPRGSGRADFRPQSSGGRDFDVTSQWDRRHTASGSTYTGSWVLVSDRHMKTVSVLSTQGGSLHTVVGMVGTGVKGNTGTYNSLDLGAGSFSTVSTREAFQYIRTVVSVGSVGSGKGSLSIAINRQA
jgi:hypothetical protein